MKKLSSLCALVFVCVLGYGAYTYWAPLQNHIRNFNAAAFFQSPLIEQIKNEIITSSPLRSNENSPNSHLTREGVVLLTNTERTSRGFKALTLNASLNKAAELKVKDMFDGQYFEHVSPSGSGPSYFADQGGYAYIVIGENLALGNFKDDKALVQAWMDSSGHRENILQEKYQEIGVAVGQGTFEGRKVWLAVQEFGMPRSACPRIDSTLKAEIDMEKTSLEKMEADLKQQKRNLDERSDPQTEEERKAYNQAATNYNDTLARYNTRVKKLKATIVTYNAQVKAFNACIE